MSRNLTIFLFHSLFLGNNFLFHSLFLPDQLGIRDRTEPAPGDEFDQCGISDSVPSAAATAAESAHDSAEWEGVEGEGA